MSTYVEKDDFMLHKQHIDTMYDILGEPAPPKSSHVLDVGGGQGMHSCFLAQRYSACYCLDIIDYQSLYQGEFCKLFKEKCRRNNVIFEEENLQFIKCGAADILFRDNYFDLVTSFNAMEHISDPAKALKEMIRVTRPEGMVYITFDPIWTADTGSHFSHQVSAPWEHLVKDTEAFINQMKKAGASDEETAEFKNAMNRYRLPQYLDIINKISEQKDVNVIHQVSWAGLTDPTHANHPNYAKCIELGYTEKELKTRGLRYVFQKSPPN